MPDMVYVPGEPPARQEPPAVPSSPPYTYQPPQYPPPKKKSRVGLVVVLAVASLVVLGGAGAIGAAIATGRGKPATSATTPAVVAATGVPVKCADGVTSNTGLPNYCVGHGGVAAATPAAKVAPDPKGFTIGITVLRKACFGSAGCNITFRIDPSYSGAEFTRTVTWEVVYQVNGATDPYSNRFTLTGSQASFQDEELIQTASASAKLTAVVVNVVEA